MIFVSFILYYGSLILCISLGKNYKNITDINMKRNYGTGLGLVLAVLICGYYIYHSLLMVWGNVIIMKCCDRSYMRRVCLVYTWMYLLFLHFNISNIYIIWLHQVQALRLVGLAFDMTLHSNRSKVNMAETEVNPSAIDIISYAYFFVGLHRGPYYKWKIYEDHFNEPFSTMGDCSIVTERKIKKACLCCVGYFLLRLKYNAEVNVPEANVHAAVNNAAAALNNAKYTVSSYWQLNWTDNQNLVEKTRNLLLTLLTVCNSSLNWVLGRTQLRARHIIDIYLLYNDSAFYRVHGADYRFLYNVPLLIMYLLHYETVVMLSTSVCTETGLGVYPAKYHALPGYGPLAHPSVSVTTISDDKKEIEFNFTALKCFNNKKLLIGPRMKDTIKSWNMPTRYWFWTNIYKHLFRANKEVRSAASFVAWIVWCGPTMPKLIIAVTLWLYVHLETEITMLYETNGRMKLPWEIGFSIMRLFCLLYLTPCFLMDDTTTIFRYYNSIFWIYHILLFAMMVAAIGVYRRRHVSQ